jgi:hypothetical protein
LYPASLTGGFGTTLAYANTNKRSKDNFERLLVCGPWMARRTRKRLLIRAKPRFCPDEKRSKAMEGFDRNLV